MGRFQFQRATKLQIFTYLSRLTFMLKDVPVIVWLSDIWEENSKAEDIRCNYFTSARFIII